jgi:hypothetical protein
VVANVAFGLGALVTGARYLFTNEYEHALLLEKSGWTEREVLNRARAWITTMGAGGVVVEPADGPTVRVDAVRDVQVVDPTGAGDGFRAGFLYGHACSVSLQRSAQLGCLVAAEVLASQGSQEYKVDRSVLTEAAVRNYGASAAADIEAVLCVAVNVADPLVAGQFGKAGFDAVGPLLLIGWSEVADHGVPEKSRRLDGGVDRSVVGSRAPEALLARRAERMRRLGTKRRRRGEHVGGQRQGVCVAGRGLRQGRRR